ncbi:hypothetical protein Esti_003782 [Eimeria stiedai]
MSRLQLQTLSGKSCLEAETAALLSSAGVSKQGEKHVREGWQKNLHNVQQHTFRNPKSLVVFNGTLTKFYACAHSELGRGSEPAANMKEVRVSDAFSAACRSTGEPNDDATRDAGAMIAVAREESYPLKEGSHEYSMEYVFEELGREDEVEAIPVCTITTKLERSSNANYWAVFFATGGALLAAGGWRLTLPTKESGENIERHPPDFSNSPVELLSHIVEQIETEKAGRRG